MARGGNVRVSITGDASGLAKTTRKAENSLDNLHAAGKRSFGGLTKAAFGYGAALVGGAGVVAGLDAVVSANNRAEVSQAKLQAQLKALGISYQDHAKQIDNVIAKTSRLSALDDEDLQDAFTAIVRSTKDVSQGLKLTGLAADIARAKHMDVAKAGELVGKVVNGNVGILKRYGIAVKDGATSQEALAAAQKKFSGQAAAFGRTSQGSMERMQVAVENLEEKIGHALSPTIAKASDKIAKFVDGMDRGTGAGGRFVKRMQDTVDALKPLVRVLGGVAGGLAAVVSWLARASANVSLFIEDVRDGSHQTGTFGAKLHSVYVVLAKITEIVGKVAAGIANTLTGAFKTAAAAIGKVVSSVKWLIDHIPKIPKPHISIPFIGDPRPGFEQAIAKANAGLLDAGTGRIQSGTYGKANEVARKFGLHVTSGYRSPEHNREVGGVEGSLHTHGSPTNPGAIDLVGPPAQMYAAQEWARKHLSLKELLVHDVGSGLHLHLGFGDPRGAEKQQARANASRAGSYSFSQLEQLWVDAGGRSSAAAIMAHIALAESSGNPNAHNPSGATGLWQILGNPFPGNAYDPITNAKMAIAKSGNGQNLHPWDASRAAWGQYVGSTPSSPLSRRRSAPAIKPERLPSLSKQFLTRHRKIAAKKQKQADATAAKRAGAINPTVDNPWLQAYLTHIDNLVAAGQMDPIVGRDLQAQAYDRAVASGQLTGEQALVAQGNARALRMQNLSDITGVQNTATTTEADNKQQELIDAQNAAAEAARQQTEAIKALKDEMEKQNKFAESVSAVSLGAAWKALADVISGQIGGYPGAAGRALTAGSGSVARY